MSEPHIRSHSGNPPSNPPADGSTMAIGVTPRPAGQIEIASPLESGSRIGPYEVREHVGDGGMAAVYKVWHTGLHRFEALKIPRYQASRGPEADFLHRLLAEARTAASLQHPHIVAIHNVSDEKSVLHYFAMEFVAGSDLAALIANNALSFEETLIILRQIGSALDYAHAHGVVHRDIKPANILLEKTDSGYHARVVDFGISRAGEDNGHTRLTRSGMIVGTPEYMSPEQAGSGADVDYRTDIYSLGVVAYEMLCGQPPFTAGDGVSRISVLMKQINEPPPPLDHCRPDLPPSASSAVLKALSKNPGGRFTSCAEFIEALAAIAPIGEQEAALLQSRRSARRGTMAALLGTPTLSPGSKAGTLQIGDTVGAFVLTPERLKAVTRRTSLAAGIIGLIIGAFLVLNMRQTQPVVPVTLTTEVPTPAATQVPRPVIVKPKPSPVPTAIPTQKVINKPTPKPAVKSVILKPAPKKTGRPASASTKKAKPLRKASLVRRASPIVRRTKSTTYRPKRRVVKPAQTRRVTSRPRIQRRLAPRPAYRSREAPLPP